MFLRIFCFVKKPIFLKYILVGLATVGTDATLLFLLAETGIDVYMAATVSFITSLIVNFSLNKLWTFGVLPNTRYQIFAYTTLITLNFIVGLLMINLFVFLHIGYMAGKLLALVITTCWNFFLYKNVVFVGTAQTSEIITQSMLSGVKKVQ